MKMLLTLLCLFLLMAPVCAQEILSEEEAQEQGVIPTAPAESDVPPPSAKSVTIQGTIKVKDQAISPVQAEINEKNIPNPTDIESVRFYYRAEEQSYYLDLKTNAEEQNAGPLGPDRLIALADEAHDKSRMDKPLEQWLFHDGPRPVVLFAKVHLYNNADLTRLHVPLTVRVRARVGERLVNPDTLLVDFTHLENSARWEDLPVPEVVIPALTPGEEMLLPVFTLNLREFITRHAVGAWPLELEITVSSPVLSGTASRILPLTPDHFMTPALDSL
ncbi:MAG: hypothetical protein AB7P76_04430 [Candidatus Melainabacteria bacterium]